jgi:hypothetical protein
MLVRAKRGVWHLIDARMPPISDLAKTAEMLINVPMAISVLVQHYTTLFPLLKTYLEIFRDATPPGAVSRYNQVRYCPNPPDTPIWEPAIDVQRVLDIGVGHVHYHQQYEKITGGELQMLRTPSDPDFIHDHLALYQFLNGPAVDADGYNDGTCNFYMLAQLRDGSFAVLYLDEQSYFSPRWRLADPSDYRGTVMTLAADLAMNPGPTGRYPWTADKYWSPFPAGKIGLTSRMAVSAQVILVTGELLVKGPDPLIYSINFSWGTMDWTWRWRSLPPGAVVRRLSDSAVLTGDETIPPGSGNTVYPQTIRLRDDMTVYMKGTRDGVAGRWFQRYLPASNELVPPPAQLVPGRQPAVGYQHAWKFMSEPLFQQADRFSHFLVYDLVDSRTQYYPVKPASDADAKQLEAIAGVANDWWIDAAQSLFNNAYTFRIDTMALPWPPWPPFPKVPMRPASLYNPQTLLKIVQRGTNWIALRRDKRDDDMALLDGLPATATLTNRLSGHTAHITILPGVRLEGPPAVQRVFFWMTGTQAFVAITPPQASQPFDNVFRVRMAALSGKAGGAITLFDLITPGQFKLVEGYFQFQWTPAADQLAAFKQYASASGERNYGTSIWLEDVVGHAAPPEELSWSPPPRVTALVTPANIPMNIPITVTVHAADQVTAVVLKGEVRIDGQRVGVTDTPFTFTFSLQQRRVFDPETRTWEIQQTEPSMTVFVEGYPETDVPLHLVKAPVLHVWVEPSSISFGTQVQVTVRAEDSVGKNPVAGRVRINGQDVAATNNPFQFLFAPTPPNGIVIASGYKDTPIPWPPMHPPRLLATIEPTPVAGKAMSYIVRAQDADTRLAVDGVVKINGQQVSRTNASFTYTFTMQRVRTFDPESRTWTITMVAPALTVSVPGYADAEINTGLGA